MAEKAWKDPIVEEVRKIRKELDKELEKDPEGFMKRARDRAIKLGFKIVSPPRKRKIEEECLGFRESTTVTFKGSLERGVTF